MGKYFFTFLCLLFCSHILFAQRDNVSLLVQSADGKNVKLVWFFKTWSKDVTGFDIKRKDGLQDWVKLNTEPIIPELTQKKNLKIVEADELEEGRVKAKLYKMITGHKISAMAKDEFLQMLNTDDKAAQALTGLMEKDYDLALMSGFGFVDHSITKKTNYQYGLFIQGTNTLLDSVLWNYGQIPDLNVVNDITAKGTTSANGIQVIWNADLMKMRAGDVTGFNIYREGIRLNSTPILPVNTKDPTEFTFFDRAANGANPNLFSISAESIFGIEGIIKSYAYNPEDHPAEYVKPVVNEINSLGYYFKEGINIKWTFPKESERFLKGFYIEKDNMPEGYVRVSGLLDSSARSYIDHTSSPVSGYIRFRAIAVYNDKTNSTGPDRVYSYFPVSQPPTPMNFKAKSAFAAKKASVQLTWDLPMNGDSSTDIYRVYVTDTLNYNLKAIDEKIPAGKNSYTYIKTRGIASNIKFCVSAIAKNEAESNYSDTITVLMPSLELPAPGTPTVVLEEEVAQIEWKYIDVADIKGFRLYQNNTLIANEDVLKKSSRKFTTQVLNKGETYIFTLKAVTTNGIASDPSEQTSILVPGKKKKA